ncbi:DoxX family protein [Rhodococcus sp. AG1013]|uniref:DoxX family protein n=1 Tax=Rhodococcus sp. BE178 TaxID=2817737 RepID=UPI0015F06274
MDRRTSDPSCSVSSRGLSIIGHAAQKSFGWLGRVGLSSTAAVFDRLGHSPGRPMVLIASIAEIRGSLLLIVGALLRWPVRSSSAFVSPSGPRLRLLLRAHPAPARALSNPYQLPWRTNEEQAQGPRPNARDRTRHCRLLLEGDRL